MKKHPDNDSSQPIARPLSVDQVDTIVRTDQPSAHGIFPDTNPAVRIHAQTG
jgi:hypothetical protein